ncbi:MAG: hypothetical protein KAS32_17980 [Candidatus Peribacteraceae bacterium]|nr:hypothetical protein [Candidatus Peribacteraceae bacterium]
MANKLNEVRARKANITLTTRCDVRFLATLLKFWHSQGEQPASASELVRLNLEFFAGFLVQKGKVEFFQSHRAALEYLDRTGLMTQAMKTKNQRNLLETLQMEDGDMEGIDPAALHKRTCTTATFTPENPLVAEVLKRVEGEPSEQEVAERVLDQENRTKEFKDHMALGPEEVKDE